MLARRGQHFTVALAPLADAAIPLRALAEDQAEEDVEAADGEDEERGVAIAEIIVVLALSRRVVVGVRIVQAESICGVREGLLRAVSLADEVVDDLKGRQRRGRCREVNQSSPHDRRMCGRLLNV